jgi:hypothetical protein
MERLDAIVRFHGGPEADPIWVYLHSLVHLLAENQLAAGELLATTKLTTLARDGLSRHDAVHAIGDAMFVVMADLGRPAEDAWRIDAELQARFDERIAGVTAEGFLAALAESNLVPGSPAWVAELAEHENAVPEELRARVLALGRDAVAPLIAVVEAALRRLFEDALAYHALDLLGELADPRGLATLVAVVAKAPDHPLADRAVLALRGGGMAVVEPALAALELPSPAGDHWLLLEVLGNAGVRDDQIFDALVAELPRMPGLMAGSLAAYGDPRALAHVHRAYARFIADFDFDRGFEMLDLAGAIERLGGSLAADEERALARWRLAAASVPDLV